jgi:DivIVA domain-containing protein
VDAFLDRVEATLAGEPDGPPVTSQQVHDVVFRVQFGGYDEWQVDLHLDRVERQIAELEERGALGRPEPRSERASSPERGRPPRHDDHAMPPVAPPMPPRPMPAQAGPPRDRYAEEAVGAFNDGYEGRHSGYDGPSGGYGVPPAPAGRGPLGHGPAGPGGPVAPAAPPGGYGRPYDGPYDDFAVGRHGGADMTTELRMPEPDFRAPARGRGMGAPPLGDPMGAPPMSPPSMGVPPMRDATGPLPMGAAPMGGPPVGGPPVGGPPVGGPPMGGPPVGGPMGPASRDLQYVDQLRRGFQVRRFGTGYDPVQVDRLFEGILAAMAGRGPMPVNPADLDSMRFDLVSGGYYEAEVDDALRQVKDILLGR